MTNASRRTTVASSPPTVVRQDPFNGEGRLVLLNDVTMPRPTFQEAGCGTSHLAGTAAEQFPPEIVTALATSLFK